MTALVTLSEGRLQFLLFHISFGTLEFFSLHRVWRASRAEPDPAARRLYTLGFASYALALCCWVTDIHLCDVLQALPPGTPQL